MTHETGSLQLGNSGSGLFNEDHALVGVVKIGAGCPNVPGFETTHSNPKLKHFWDIDTASVEGALDPVPTGQTSLLPIANYDLDISDETFSDEDTDFAGGFFRTAAAITATDLTLEDTGKLHLRARENITIDGDFLAEAGGDLLVQVDEWTAPSSKNARVGEGPEAVPETHEAFALTNYPNPFTTQTTFSFTVEEESRVVLKVYDMLGRELVTLFDMIHPAGNVTLHWNPSDDNGDTFPAGVYLYQLRVGEQRQSRTFTVLK